MEIYENLDHSQTVVNVRLVERGVHLGRLIIVSDPLTACDWTKNR
jgi:hypothetical protein